MGDKIWHQQDKLTLNQDSGLKTFYKWYEGNVEILSQLQQVDQTIYEAISEQVNYSFTLVTSKSELDVIDKAISRGDKWLEKVKKNIKELEEQLAKAKKEEQELEKARSKC